MTAPALRFRGYSWGNMYFSQIQQGIQGWHAQNQFFKKYRLNSPEIKTFLIWATKHETLVLLNGGPQSSLLEIERVLNKLARQLRRNPADQREMGVRAIPVARFNEEQDAVNGATTAVFTVLPSTAYCLDDAERQRLSRLTTELGFRSPLEAADVGRRRGRVISLADRFKLVAMTGKLA